MLRIGGLRLGGGAPRLPEPAHEIVPCGAVWSRGAPELEAAPRRALFSAADDVHRHCVRLELAIGERDLEPHERAKRGRIAGAHEQTLEAHVRGLEGDRL